MSDPANAVPTGPGPAPPGAGGHDPLAVALGNASLLGVGYLMMRRRGLAVAALLGTAVSVSVPASTAWPSYEATLLLWWAAVIIHGWTLARRSADPVAARGRRLVALAVALPVLLTVGLLRIDASMIGQSLTDARESGDCAQVRNAESRFRVGHRVAAASSTARGDAAVRACKRLQVAGTALATALTGDIDALEEGFEVLAAVLAEPGNEAMVEATLTGFLDGLPAKDACDTVAVTDWLRDRERSHDVLDRSADAVERTAPAALVGCGDDHLEDGSWKKARTRYRQLLDQYPGDGLADTARKGSRQATQGIELANVRGLLTSSESGPLPEYCTSPARYSGAEPMGKGTNRALFYGDDESGDHVDELPGSWKADDAADAVLVVCMGEQTFGTAVQTCPYGGATALSTTNVTFSKIALPVQVYEVRTGEIVADRKIQIGGTSCPAVLEYSSYGFSDLGPPSDAYVEASTSGTRAAFRPLVVR